MLRQLPRDQLADVACADDDRVLHVARASPAGRASGAARHGHEGEGKRPERRELRQVGLDEPGEERREKRDPDDDRDDVEDADEVVHGRASTWVARRSAGAGRPGRSRARCRRGPRSA